MKRIIACLLVLLMLAPLALADDVASMSDADLKALYKAVKEELMIRKLWDNSILPAGLYQAGKTLPEGTYECVAKQDCSVHMYKDYESFLNDKCFEYFYPDENEAFVISLYGEICYLINNECTVRPFVGLDW